MVGAMVQGTNTDRHAIWLSFMLYVVEGARQQVGVRAAGHLSEHIWSSARLQQYMLGRHKVLTNEQNCSQL